MDVENPAMEKVYDALRAACFVDDSITDLVTILQNAGIEFTERRKMDRQNRRNERKRANNMTEFIPSEYDRHPFTVEAVQVTAENMDRVATWCDGTIVTPESEERYIKVNVHKPLNEKQTKAFVGTWVLKQQTSFKVYTDKAFGSNFSIKGALPPNPDLFTPIETPIYDSLRRDKVITKLDDGTHQYVFQAGDTGTLRQVYPGQEELTNDGPVASE